MYQLQANPTYTVQSEGGGGIIKQEGRIEPTSTEVILLPQHPFPILRYVKLSPFAFAPERATDLAAGLDLKSAYDYMLPSQDRTLVLTDLAIQVPHGTYARIAQRSSMALGKSIAVGGGVIDADYRGNIGVILFNFSHQNWRIGSGDKIAQLICEKIEYPAVMEVEMSTFNEVPTRRGQQGFGSTGT